MQYYIMVLKNLNVVSKETTFKRLNSFLPIDICCYLQYVTRNWNRKFNLIMFSHSISSIVYVICCYLQYMSIEHLKLKNSSSKQLCMFFVLLIISCLSFQAFQPREKWCIRFSNFRIRVIESNVIEKYFCSFTIINQMHLSFFI